MSQIHTPGKTTQTAQRAPQDFTRSMHHVVLDDECTKLLLEASGNPSRRATRTLSKNSAMTVAMMAIIGGTEIVGHNAHGAAVLQTLRGEVRVGLEDGLIELTAGELITLASGVRHDLSTVVDTVVLLVVATE